MWFLKSLLGKKLGMTQVFDERGNVVPITAIEAGPCSVIVVKTPERDGYAALQLGFGPKKRARTKKPEEGHLKKANVEPCRFVREVPMPDGQFQAGEKLTVETFSEVDFVAVTGISKGRGFQGVQKRYGMRGGPASHGSTSHRRVGSIGASAYPARVMKGQKMPGHMGSDVVTVRRLKVVKVDKERNLLLVKGAVPGPRGGYLVVREVK